VNIKKLDIAGLLTEKKETAVYSIVIVLFSFISIVYVSALGCGYTYLQ